jgi:hypothetical protein
MANSAAEKQARCEAHFVSVHSNVFMPRGHGAKCPRFL